MAGALTLASDPAAPLQAATKNYVDNQVATLVPTTGGTLAGALTLAGDPTSALQATTKQYTDAQVATTVPKAGGTMTGPLTLAADPTCRPWIHLPAGPRSPEAERSAHGKAEFYTEQAREERLQVLVAATRAAHDERGRMSAFLGEVLGDRA